MRLLVDANLSPVVATRLRSEHDTVHVWDVELLHADHDEILGWAAAHDCTVVALGGSVVVSCHERVGVGTGLSVFKVTRNTAMVSFVYGVKEVRSGRRASSG